VDVPPVLVPPPVLLLVASAVLPVVASPVLPVVVPPVVLVVLVVAPPEPVPGSSPVVGVPVVPGAPVVPTVVIWAPVVCARTEAAVSSPLLVVAAGQDRRPPSSNPTIPAYPACHIASGD
jgi:hypothetical protein